MVIPVIINSVTRSSLKERKHPSGTAIMGGTFDPIHNGHLRAAVEIVDRFAFRALRLIPCYQPVHKGQPSVTAQQRLDMVEKAISCDERLLVDSREILRKGPSYSIDTLKEIRQEVGPDEPLIMVLGMDSFLSLPTWHNWQALIEYAHLLVVSRPGWEPDFISELQTFCENCRATSAHELQCAPSGFVWFEMLPSLEISSSMIRALCKKQESIAYLLPEPVQNYIKQNNLYL
ncbi:putative nicotinate-nucleotide adenylyltransferase [Marinomonas spartinae]|uniref:Probable nicotinate-nucleotide adenylyltransferase n=1 Tax=Marinomonas spartinae TaxID=1792290 RepID=A0A1A8TE45_9GAMM|nr:nicotinate-nucleotide adenylyltransferase [Marinomonas spartinae]SBS31502.1 putative nicotinate-nucleotide adenylyltransferase [Marinomonas spartinae]SBS33629.1 putative nicotinate-nucleotide adenylyltransferase [Marinomonas spartinae]